MSRTDPGVTVSIVTRDRPESLLRCLRSLSLAAGRVARAVVFDDGSDPPVEGGIRAALEEALPFPLEFLRDEQGRGAAFGRNAVLRAASTELVLQLDDDALLVSADALRKAAAVMEGDPAVAAVAFAQADGEGRRWPPSAQPAPVDYRCQVPAFIGFGALLRRRSVLQAGGYLDVLEMHGEERDLCIRLLDRGERVIYLPDAAVGHLADPANRSRANYLHLTIRNSLLTAVHHEPLPLALATLLPRFLRYYRMRGADPDPGGARRLVRGFVGSLPVVWRARRPVRWATVRRWRRLARAPLPYRGPDSPAAA